MIRTATCRALAACLLSTLPITAQEIINLPGEDRWIEPRFEELYRVGSLSGEDWEQFGSIRRVAFDGSGQLYVFDKQARYIFVVGQGGELRHTLGGPGDGPGEFRNPDGLAVMRDGRVAILDTGYPGFHLFNADGEYERRVRLPGSGSRMMHTDYFPYPGGDAVVSAVGSLPLLIQFFDEGRDQSHTSRPVERLILTGDMVTRDTVAEGWLPPGRGTRDDWGAVSEGLRAEDASGGAARWKRGLLGLLGLRNQGRTAGYRCVACPETPASADPGNGNG